MQWAEAVPNLVIGLREGLETGLVITILLAAVRKLREPGDSKGATVPIWLGVVGATSLAGSFAAVLTFSTAVLSTRAQATVGGLLSIGAVALVTVMIFWMRRTAMALSAQLRAEVQAAVALGSGALALTAFAAVAREGLETTLFVWTAIRAAGETSGPLVGAGLGLAVAWVLCWLLYRRAVRFNLGAFFSRTAVLLIVIGAGIFAYGLRELQEAGLLPGLRWVAFDVTHWADPNSWWVTLITGLTNLAPQMTMLQAVGWATYLVVVLTMFMRARSAVSATAPAPQISDPRWVRGAGRRPVTTSAVLILAPAVIAGLIIGMLPASAANTTALTVTTSACASGWVAPTTGTQTFRLTNDSSRAGEVMLLDDAGGIVGEIETLGPGTTVPLTATIGTDSYHFRCLMAGGTTTESPTLQARGQTAASTHAAAPPASIEELTPPNRTYQAYASKQLHKLAADVRALRTALRRGEVAAARRNWLAAQLDWERVGASYNSFGAAGTAIDGLAGGLPRGVNDPGFTGLHRIEYGLYHAQAPAALLRYADRLLADVNNLRRHLTSTDIAGDPTTLTLRVHEILEDAQRDHLSGSDDQGAGAAYAMTYADAKATRAILMMLKQPITDRAPRLVATAANRLNRLLHALRATREAGTWPSPWRSAPAKRAQVNSALGAALETLSEIPGLLEVPLTR